MSSEHPTADLTDTSFLLAVRSVPFANRKVCDPLFKGLDPRKLNSEYEMIIAHIFYFIALLLKQEWLNSWGSKLKNMGGIIRITLFIQLP